MQKRLILSLYFLVIFILSVKGQISIIKNDSIVFVEQTLKRVSKNVNFTILPGPTYGTTEKLGFAVLPMIVYNLKKTDTLSPPSSTAILIYFDFYGSWLTAVKQSFYWNQNKWRAFITTGVGNLQLKFFGIGCDTAIISNSEENFVWTHQKELDINLTCFRKIYRGLFGGLEYRYTLSDLQGSDSASTAKVMEAGVPTGEITITTLVPTFVWDNRDNIFWSTKGYYASVNFQYSNSIFFNSKDYSIMAGWVSGYHNLLKTGNRLILAWHLFAQTGWGEMPYRVYANYGKGDHVTGYTSGKYVNYSEATVQAEIRYDLWKFIALGGYIGTGKTFPSFSLFGPSVWLHYTGVRLYLNMIPSRNIRLRLDAAMGRKDWGFYVGIGQAF